MQTLNHQNMIDIIFISNFFFKNISKFSKTIFQQQVFSKAELSTRTQLSIDWILFND